MFLKKINTELLGFTVGKRTPQNFICVQSLNHSKLHGPLHSKRTHDPATNKPLDSESCPRLKIINSLVSFVGHRVGITAKPVFYHPSQSILFHQRYLGHHHQKRRGCARGAIINIKTNVAGGACLLTKDDGVALLCDGVSLGTRKQEDETRDIIIIIRKLRVILFAEILPGPQWRLWVWRKSSSGMIKK